MQNQTSRRPAASSVVAALALFACMAVPAAAAVPVGQTYFTVLVGFEGPYDLMPGCLRFTPREMCINETLCGPWTVTETGGPETGLAFEAEWENSGLMIRFDGQARVDNRGARSSIGGAARVGFGGANQNVSFAGRATSWQRCVRLANDFMDMSLGWAEALCLGRADFGDPADSLYVLPYPVGQAYVVSQSYCAVGGSHHAKFSYDFDMPVGTPILAARDGVVWMGHDGYLDDDTVGDHTNTLWIEHADGSVAQYAHLSHASILLEPGEAVVAGQRIATSGETGSYGFPHLHFAVYKNRQLFDYNSLSVNFRNVGGALDERGGLSQGVSYEALP